MSVVNPFGILVSGSLPTVDFKQMSETEFLIGIPQASTNVAVFLTGQVTLPDDHAVGVFLCWTDDENNREWLYLGYFTNNKPSVFYRLSNIKSIDRSGRLGEYLIGLRIDQESILSQKSTALSTCSQATNAAEITLKIAERLYNYIISFNRSPNTDIISVSTNTITQCDRSFYMSVNWDQEKMTAKTRSNFNFVKIIGEGSFSTVYLCTEKKSELPLAVKCVKKELAVKQKVVKYMFVEKDALTKLTDYYGLEYCPKGSMYELIQKHGPFKEDLTAFYMVEIGLAMKFMHDNWIIHRDLKPENILLSERFHVRLSDFGSACMLKESEEGSEEDYENDTLAIDSSSSSSSSSESDDDKDAEVTDIKNEQNKSSSGTHRKRRGSFVGSAQFISPEVLRLMPPHRGSDYWAYGCLLYQLLSGKMLFSGSHQYDIFQMVLSMKFYIPYKSIPPEAEDLIRKLLVKNPTKRYGVHDFEMFKSHQFFQKYLADYDCGEKWTCSYFENIDPPLQKKEL